MIKKIYKRMPSRVRDIVPIFVTDYYVNRNEPNVSDILNKVYQSDVIDSPNINILIVGGRDPFYDINEIKHIKNKNIVAVEPDKNECKKLQEKYPKHNFHPIALAEHTGKTKLYITKKPEKSSIYEPDYETLNDWGCNTEKYDVFETIDVETTSLDEFAEKHNYTFDFIKMDCQGAEGDIISGGEKTIENSLGIMIEQNIIKVYKGTPTYWDLFNKISNLGFELVKSSQFKAKNVDACYLDEEYLNSLNYTKFVVLALILEYPALAYFIVQNSRDRMSKEEYREFEKIFASRSKNKSF